MQNREQRGICLSGARCREARRALGFTQERLADASRGPESLSLATIKRAEAGAAIDITSARRLAALLRTDLTALRGAESARPSEPPPTSELPGKPRRAAIAVLPFAIVDTRSRKAPQVDFLSDGLVEDLICRLGTWWFPLISRCSTAHYRGALPRPTDIGARLDARYLVSGAVRRGTKGTVITVELSETETEQVVWAGQFDDQRWALPRLPDEVSQRIAGQIGNSILREETARAYRAPYPQDVDAWQTALRGAWHFYRGTAEDNERARTYFRESLSRDPLLRCAHYWLCMSHQQDLTMHWSKSPTRSLHDLQHCCEEFRRLHPKDPYMLTVAAYGGVYSGDRSAALGCLREAIAHDQNFPVARLLHGQVLAMANQAEQAVPELMTAMRLSPLDPKAYTFKVALALAHFVLEQYAEMVRWSEAALRDSANYALAYAALACGLAYLKETERARQALARMMRIGHAHRSLSVLMASTAPEIERRFRHGLELAGMRS